MVTLIEDLEKIDAIDLVKETDGDFVVTRAQMNEVNARIKNIRTILNSLWMKIKSSKCLMPDYDIYKLKFTPEAVEDITGAAEYYERCQPGLGKRFRSEVKRKLVLLKKIPGIYTLRYGEVRFALN